MNKALANRIARLETLATETKEARTCICRGDKTTCHDAKCLAAVLRGIPLVCPVHGWRNLGRIWVIAPWVVLRYRVGGDDNRFCPCPPHPWRSFVLKRVQSSNKHPSWEESAVAMEAWKNLPPDPPTDFEMLRRDLRTVLDQYSAACELWIQNSKRQ